MLARRPTFCIGIITAYFAWRLSREYLIDGGVEQDEVPYSRLVWTVVLWVVSFAAFIGYMIGIAKLSEF
jgi:hypothetical protein